jgi:simple sugar transport system permease protein
MTIKKRPLKRNESYLLAIILIYSIIVAINNPAFLSFENFFDLLRAASGKMLLALGVLVVLISGGIDVSFTAIAIFGGYTSARVMLATGIDNLAFAFLVSAGIGILLGSINALIIHFFRLPTLIATLGTSSVFFGLMTILVGTRSINAGQMPSSIINFGSARLFEAVAPSGNTYGLSVFIIPVALAILVTWFILYRTMLGRGIFALGNSEESAKRAGFNLFLIRFFVYTYVGLLAGIMGVVYVAEVRWVNPVSLVGSELAIIAATVIGGAKLTGGEGTILGTVLGITIIQLFNSTLVFLGLSSSWNDLFVGLILLISVSVTSYQQRLKSRRSLTFSD